MEIFTPIAGQDKVRTVYAVTFAHLDEIPKLEKSGSLMSHLEITLKNQESYVVASDINDKNLRELIMSEFNLKPNQVFVASRRFANF